jgi:hypothetical protein
MKSIIALTIFLSGLSSFAATQEGLVECKIQNERNKQILAYKKARLLVDTAKNYDLSFEELKLIAYMPEIGEIIMNGSGSLVSLKRKRQLKGIATTTLQIPSHDIEIKNAAAMGDVPSESREPAISSSVFRLGRTTFLYECKVQEVTR